MSKRRSMQLSPGLGASKPLTLPVQSEDSDQWAQTWRQSRARDLINSEVVYIEAERPVEDACDLLLSQSSPCVAIRLSAGGDNAVTGLFDFADVNAFLTIAATRHTMSPEEIQDEPRVDRIIQAAKAGVVPVQLVSDLSEKNPLATLPHDATILDLFETFSSGTHRVLIRSDISSSSSTSPPYLGFVSDRNLLEWLSQYAERTPSFKAFLETSLENLPLPSLNIRTSMISASPKDAVLDAMQLMSTNGVSSIAIVDDNTGLLLSAVSVTDIGNVVAPSQSKDILTAPLHLFIQRIKGSDGTTDGVDKYPVYSVLPSSTLSFTMRKILATNAHRVFTLYDPDVMQPLTPLSSASSRGNLSGIVSVLDILSLFARLANVPNVDPTQLMHRRRASSTSSARSSHSNSSHGTSTSGRRLSTHVPVTDVPFVRSPGPA